MPRFSAPAAKPSYGSGFDNVAMRDTFADFRAWWDRACLLAEAPVQAPKGTSLPMAA
ncbi:hypothetical protein [Salipiger mangrovisoli]|uniref:Uncharacterized protein n=1 Tax=Salipiger mangrovisoli TaxID=2865933 RepID=A0ABR9X1X9_9RHOB|nr:hypothetical protein [Salipiger mangrovisoli]MBE9637475.1 hypothetical protein [Salipiger mangrovisoli]